MVDLLLAILEALLGTGVHRTHWTRNEKLVSSPQAWRWQSSALLRGLAWKSPTATIMLVLTAGASGWIILFSVVGVIKEPGRSRWWSTSASIVGAVTLTLSGCLLVR